MMERIFNNLMSLSVFRSVLIFIIRGYYSRLIDEFEKNVNGYGIYRHVEYWKLELDQNIQNLPPKRRHESSVFTLKEIEDATCSFSEENLLGKRGFGKVYKGKLASGEQQKGSGNFGWPVRFKVAIGVARGHAYLHSSSAVGIPVVHRDFKSTNILLSDDYEAKVLDVGLTKLMLEGQETHVTARVLRTFGYFNLEYTSVSRKVTLQSDVYAFGVVLLELLTGRRAVDLNQGPNDQNLVLQDGSM
ncbi:putative protein kinase RLK-Pelle-RLCK-VIIb family [Helianthus debilis subsp. tardiflorus]